MRPPSPSVATTLARLATDAATARSVSDAITEGFDAEEVAAAAFEEADGRWSLTLHFRQQPDETAVRALIAAAAGSAAADALVFEMLAPTDWVRKGLEGLPPVDAGRFVVHGAHAGGGGRGNVTGLGIRAGAASGTGSPDTHQARHLSFT